MWGSNIVGSEDAKTRGYLILNVTFLFIMKNKDKENVFFPSYYKIFKIKKAFLFLNYF